MQLPTDQYVLIPLPNNAKLEKKSDNLFSLRVPELQIFNVWLRPHVVSSVDVTPEGVIIEAVECRLDGSPEVQRLDLNSKFELSVKVVLQGYQGAVSSPASALPLCAPGLRIPHASLLSLQRSCLCARARAREPASCLRVQDASGGRLALLSCRSRCLRCPAKHQTLNKGGTTDPRGLRSMLTCRSEISVWVDPPQVEKDRCCSFCLLP